MAPKTNKLSKSEISFLFYPKDWLADPKLRRVSLAAKAVWMDLICLMWLSEPKGYIEPEQTVTHLSHQVFCDESVIQELIDGDILRKNEHGWYSKKLLEVIDERTEWKERQRNHRDKKKREQVEAEPSRESHADVTPLSHASESESQSESIKEVLSGSSLSVVVGQEKKFDFED